MDSSSSETFEWEVRDDSIPFRTHAFAGSCAGVMEHVAMFPVDTVKTRLQASPVCARATDVALAVIRERGFAGFMRGATAIGAGCIPAHIGLFGTYELASSALVDRNLQEHQPCRVAACGAAASIVHDVVLTPHDVVKQRLQLGRYSGVIDCVSSAWRYEGVGAFYRSLPATMAMNIPFTGVLVAVNESLKLMLRLQNHDADAALSNASNYFLCAGIGGAVAAFVTSPLDVVKTRLQTQCSMAHEAMNPGSKPKYAGLLSAFQGVLQEQGLRGLMRGVGPRVLLAAPAAAISWGTYETICSNLSRINSEAMQLARESQSAESCSLSMPACGLGLPLQCT